MTLGRAMQKAMAAAIQNHLVERRRRCGEKRQADNERGDEEDRGVFVEKAKAEQNAAPEQGVWVDRD